VVYDNGWVMVAPVVWPCGTAEMLNGSSRAFAVGILTALNRFIHQAAPEAYA
jgi:hypothetical protein